MESVDWTEGVIMMTHSQQSDGHRTSEEATALLLGYRGEPERQGSPNGSPGR